MFRFRKHHRESYDPTLKARDLEDYIFGNYGVEIPWSEVKRELRGQEGLTIFSPEFDAAVRRAIAYYDCSVEGVVVAI